MSVRDHNFLFDGLLLAVFLLVVQWPGAIRGELSIYLPSWEMYNLVGLRAELYYLHEGKVNDYALGFEMPVPPQVSPMHFAWRRTDSSSSSSAVARQKFIHDPSQRKYHHQRAHSGVGAGPQRIRYSIALRHNVAAGGDLRALKTPTINITKRGVISSAEEEIFGITLECSGLYTANIHLEVLINVTYTSGDDAVGVGDDHDDNEDQNEAIQLVIKRKKFCYKQEEDEIRRPDPSVVSGAGSLPPPPPPSPVANGNHQSPVRYPSDHDDDEMDDYGYHEIPNEVSYGHHKVASSSSSQSVASSLGNMTTQIGGGHDPPPSMSFSESLVWTLLTSLTAIILIVILLALACAIRTRQGQVSGDPFATMTGGGGGGGLHGCSTAATAAMITPTIYSGGSGGGGPGACPSSAATSQYYMTTAKRNATAAAALGPHQYPEYQTMIPGREVTMTVSDAGAAAAVASFPIYSSHLFNTYNAALAATTTSHNERNFSGPCRHHHYEAPSDPFLAAAAAATCMQVGSKLHMNNDWTAAVSSHWPHGGGCQEESLFGSSSSAASSSSASNKHEMALSAATSH